MMASRQSVNVGLVGTSWWADAMYLPALKNHPQADVMAVCGRNPARTQAFADDWSIPSIYTDYEAMIEEAALDAIIISTPNRLHYPITMKALERGLHVLCEKPLAMNYAQAKTMTEAAHDAGVINMVPFTYSYMPTARYLKVLVDEGYIGQPYHLNMRYYTGYGRTNDYMWRFDRGEAGAGVVGDLGTHFIYLARWFYGEITAVQCLLGYHQPQRDPRPDGQPYDVGDDSAMLLLEFASGAQGAIHVTAMCYEDTPFGQTHHMELHGSAGTLYSFTDWDRVQQVSGARVGEGPVKELPIPDAIWGKARRDTVHNTYRDVFREHDFMARGFITAIVSDEPVKPDFEDALAVQRVLEAALRSAAEKRRVIVAEIE